MKTYNVILIFTREVSFDVKVNSEKEAIKLAEKVQFSDHPRVKETWEGAYGDLICTDSCELIQDNEKTIKI